MKKIFLLLSAMIFCACPFNYGYKYDTGTFPEEVINLASINSPYDDFNATAPFIRDEFPLCFSSNRNSQGGQMDIVFKLMAIDFDKESGELKVYNETNGNLDVTERHGPLSYMVSKINTSNDEFGPYVKSYGFDLYNSIPGYDYMDGIYDDYLILYATEVNDHLDIHFTHNRSEEIVPAPVQSINTSSNEAYPCFNDIYNEMYFCSDRSGDFDIFSVDWDHNKKIELSLSDTLQKEARNLDILNSEFEDKCPYIDDNIIVFTSDRPGGYGGFDLYYSKLGIEGWGAPVNFGDKINSPHDEYRPIVRLQDQFNNDFLLFSSNRPGGEGGFDLYYTGFTFE